MLQWREPELIIKHMHGLDCCLQLDNMKLELLVIVNQNVTVKSYLNFVHTACQVSKVIVTPNGKDNFRTFILSVRKISVSSMVSLVDGKTHDCD